MKKLFFLILTALSFSSFTKAMIKEQKPTTNINQIPNGLTDLLKKMPQQMQILFKDIISKWDILVEEIKPVQKEEFKLLKKVLSSNLLFDIDIQESLKLLEKNCTFSDSCMIDIFIDLTLSYFKPEQFNSTKKFDRSNFLSTCLSFFNDVIKAIKDQFELKLKDTKTN
jgi:hypothetical protein